MSALTDTAGLKVHVDGTLRPFTTAAEVSAAYLATIAASGMDLSGVPFCEIVGDDMVPVGFVDDRGRVWSLGTENSDGTFDAEQCVYEPRGEAA